ncbi:hypothetical protein [Microbacterium elymi]|uniref:Uncharacterized protein n=1 Tax=Microbacterium elymi TaxID=2909587 RepID=A0ABY5NMQ0_9MICO|nr:hypothetical protein [Microbacterium elymi]UUT36437.1 hypothetical protein L2X98_26345 [Microbacterium elymi]
MRVIASMMPVGAKIQQCSESNWSRVRVKIGQPLCVRQSTAAGRAGAGAGGAGGVGFGIGRRNPGTSPGDGACANCRAMGCSDTSVSTSTRSVGSAGFGGGPPSSRRTRGASSGIDGSTRHPRSCCAISARTSP